MREGLIQTALERVEEIKSTAKTDEIRVKASVYLAYLNGREKEYSREKVIEGLQAELVTYPPGTAMRSVIHAALGNQLRGYAASIYNRPDVEEEDPADSLKTWSRGRILRAATDNYLKSLENPAALIAVKVTDWNQLIWPGNEIGRAARPTLYDLLVYEVLNYLQQARSMIAEPVYAFNTDRPELFAPLDEFTIEPFLTRDTSSMVRHSLVVFQQLLIQRRADYRDNSRNLPALIEAELARLNFARQVYSGQNELYLPALNRLAETYPGNELVIMAQAEYWKKVGDAYRQEEGTETERMAYVRAAELADRIDGDEVAAWIRQPARKLLADLRTRIASVDAEKVALPGRAILIKLSFRNVERVHIRVLKASETQALDDNQRLHLDDVYHMFSDEPVQTKLIDLPQTDDLRLHTTEIALDELPEGPYIIVISDDKTFTPGKGASGAVFFWVSGMTLLTQSYGQYHTSTGQSTDITVVDRNTGRPLADVAGTVLLRIKRDSFIVADTFLTDRLGNASYLVTENSLYFVRLERGSDYLINREYFSARERKEDIIPYLNMTTALFTDRGTYRPGQTVFFKGIVYLPTAEGENNIVPDQDIIIAIYGANRREMMRQSFRTNSFGSIQGRFILPTTVQLGGFQIVASINGRRDFQVEEYKRPRFEVKLDANADEPIIGDSIRLTGRATTYAGPPAAGARVSYTITRKAIYSRYFFDYSNPYRRYSREPEATIATGTVQTDDEGKFELNYVAKPAGGRAARADYFVYRTAVNVTDDTGETQVAKRSLSVGRVPLYLRLTLPAPAEAQDSISVYRTNYDGQPRSGPISLSIHRAVTPGGLLIDRYWDKPDKPLLDSASFKRLFPDYAYGNETDPANYGRGERLRQVGGTIN
ncbi:MAG: MG2 domain-containing protein, partial [Saprospiraceae bacterium]